MSDSVDFLIKLQEQVSGPASKAQQAFVSLQREISKETGALSQLEQKLASTAAAMAKMNSGSSVNVNAFQKLQKQHGDLAQQIAGKQQNISQLSSGLGKFQQQAAASTHQTNALTASIEELAFPTTAVVAGFGLITAAIAAAGAKLAQFAFSTADSKRSLLLTYEALTGTASGAKELDDIVDSLEHRVPLAGARLEDLAKQLATAGISGNLMKESLEAIAKVESAVGQGGSEALTAALKKSSVEGHFDVNVKALKESGLQLDSLYANIAQRMGIGKDQVEAQMAAGKVSMETGVAALNDVINTKLGNVADKQMLSFDVQMVKLKDRIGDLFEDIDVEPLLVGLKDLLSIFDNSTASGQSLHDTMTDTFTSIAKLLAEAMPFVKEFGEGFIDALTEIPGLFTQMEDSMGGDDHKQFAQDMRALGKALGGIVTFMAAVVAGTMMFARGLATVDSYLGPIAEKLGGWASLGIDFVSPISMQFGELASILTGLPEKFASLGADIVNGLIEGIASNASGAVDAVVDMVGQMVGAGRARAGAHSPATEFIDLAGDMGDGLVVGARAKRPAVEGAIADMAGPPREQVSAGLMAAVSGMRGGGFNFSGTLNLHANTEKEARAAARVFLEEIADGLAMGGIAGKAAA